MPHLSFMCIKKTTQIQGNSAPLKHSANRIVLNHLNEVRVLLWIYTAVKSRVRPTGAPPMISYPGTIQKKQFHSVHAISQMGNQNITSQPHNLLYNVTYINELLKGTQSISSQVGKYCHKSPWRHFKVNIAWPCSSSPVPAFKGLLIHDHFQKKLQVLIQSFPSHLQTKPLQEHNSAKYLLSCRDIPQHSWQRTDLPSPLGLPPHEDPQELDWKGLQKEKKRKGYGDMTLRGHCCFFPRASPPHSWLLTKDTELESKVLLPARGKVCSHRVNVEMKFLKVLNVAASQKP